MVQTGGAAAAKTANDCLQHAKRRPTFSESWFHLNDAPLYADGVRIRDMNSFSSILDIATVKVGNCNII